MKRFFTLLFILIPFLLSSQIRINELMPKNVSFNMDDAYNYSMWVEVYNSSSSNSDNLSNYYFTDDPKNPKMWNPQDKNLTPKSFTVLYFEREERPGHANFKLDPEGGTLYMFNSSKIMVDSITYPAQYRNVSFGRLRDGTIGWGFFEKPTPGKTNNFSKSFTQRCSAPALSIAGGFYPVSQNPKFLTPSTGDTIYFTKDGSEPTKNSTKYIKGASISINSTTVLRAMTSSSSKLSSDVITTTIFINQRQPKLPVVSIVTDKAYLFDKTIGIYVAGINGITGNGQNSPVNFNQDWDRPVNFEFFDTTGITKVNREVDIKIVGGWTRSNALKSIAICPKNKHGDNLFRYDFFASTKPNRKYKDIQMRNSGNDFNQSMLRDAFMQSLIMHRMDLDYLAYEPAVIFINGEYYGIENLRERSNKDYMYSNYGLEDDKVTLIEATNLGVNTEIDIATDPGHINFMNFVKNNDLTDPVYYDSISKRVDIDEFINYMIAQIYIANTDWPYNNLKMWNVTSVGKWRWIYFDTDFGFSNVSHNSLTFALGENNSGIIGGYTTPPEWSVLLFKRLILNSTFRNKFIDRFAIHISTTYEKNRVTSILDSLSVKIVDEMPYHYNRYGGSISSFNNTINSMKSFAGGRPGMMLKFISDRFVNSVPVYNLKLNSNIPGSTYLFNNEPVLDSDATLQFFKNRKFEIKANPVKGYKFKQWQTLNSGSNYVLENKSTWKYFDGDSIPAKNWNSSGYDDSSWSSGTAPLGYGDPGNATTIGYGGNINYKYITAYFRKTVNIVYKPNMTSFKITCFVDDGAVIYFNGTEVGRINMSNATVGFNSVSSTSNEGVEATIEIPQNLIKSGNNVIAVEAHQYNVTSSDLIFELKMTYSSLESDVVVYKNEIYSDSLTTDKELQIVYEKSEDNPEGENTIFINEVVASNNVIDDEFGGNDDYIEIYNSGNSSVNIAGWYISDTPANPGLHQILSTDASKTTVPAHGRLIFWADSETGQGIAHLGFKLGKEGEKIVLSFKNNLNEMVVVDSVTYPIMDANLSYSRLPDGGPNWIIQATTFNSTNNISSTEPVTVSEIGLYPTMVTSSFTLVNALGKEVILRDISGKIMFRTSCTSDNELISVDMLQKGLYLVSVGNKTIKIVKK